MQKRLFYLFISLLLIMEIKGECQSNSSKKILYSDTSQFKSMEAVLNIPAFKGKVVYIDLWGTRCGPCLDEFKYLKVLKERYKDKPVSFLYLKSPYDFDDSKEWKEMVNRYNLEGINVSMSINFYVNGFWERFKKNYPEKKIDYTEYQPI